tara:strand:+ start:130 stop:477 length:348 start_codon:yes stop_codon:yes gene_type:complete
MTKRDYKNEPYPTWARFVDGELDLQTAFWGYLIGGTIVWSILSGILSVIPFFKNGWFVSMAIGVFFITNRVWVCAGNYMKEKNKINKPVVWGILTKCVCILNALSMLGILYAEMS